MINQNVSRRHFLKVSAIAGGSMVIGFNMLDAAKASGLGEGVVFSPNAFIKIDSTGLITLMSPNPEIGQGVKTALPMILAEELNVAWDKVQVDMAPLDPKFGSQTAGGSGAIRGRFTPIRQAGATARVMLISAAAQNWSVSAEECFAEDGFVIHKASGKKAGYGELAAKAATLTVPTDLKLKEPKDFKIIGTRVGNIDNHKIVTGQPLYGIDTRREGMQYAMVVRAPAFGKKLVSFDDTETRKVTGVKNVIQVKNFVAILASSTYAAKKGKLALKTVWEDVAKLESTVEHEATFKELLEKKTERPARSNGDVDAAFAAAAKVIEAVYEAPTLSHATMEPLNFFADVKDGKAELYGPTQVPGRMRTDVANALSIPPAAVTLGMPRQGGGFGRKLQADNGLDAALISAAAKVPVLLLWTREDDMQGDFYRPSSMYKYKAAIGADNELMALHATSAAIGGGISNNGFPAGALANFRSDAHSLQTNIQLGPWRAPGHNSLAFANESFLDEIAVATKKDPVAMRLALLEKAASSPAGTINYVPAKLKGVIEEVAAMSNWGKNTRKDVFQGFSAYFSFNTYVAQVAEVTKVKGVLRVSKVYCAVNCGRVVNLSGAESQVEGAIVDGLSHAMFSQVTFDKGAVVETNFHKYKFMRMKDAPLDIVVKFISTEDAPTGLGEPGLPPIAPAIANAVFAATGKRIRKMPFNLEGV